MIKQGKNALGLGREFVPQNNVKQFMKEVKRLRRKFGDQGFAAYHNGRRVAEGQNYEEVSKQLKAIKNVRGMLIDIFQIGVSPVLRVEKGVG